MLRHCAMVVCVTTVFLSAIGTAPAVSYYFQDLGAIGGDTSFGYGISPAGEVVGITGTGGTSSRPFAYSNGTMSLLDRGPYFKGGFAYDANTSGAVAGNLDVTDGMFPPTYKACISTSTA